VANIDRFRLGPNLYDLDGLTHDVLGKILTDHAGEENAVSHTQLCQYYFGTTRVSLEGQLLLSNILQRARGILQAGGWFLDFRKRSGWFAVRTTIEAYDHVVRYTKREIRLHHRLETKADIIIGDHYQLSADNPLIQAIEGVGPAIEQLEEAVRNPQLPAPPELEDFEDEDVEQRGEKFALAREYAGLQSLFTPFDSMTEFDNFVKRTMALPIDELRSLLARLKERLERRREG